MQDDYLMYSEDVHPHQAFLQQNEQQNLAPIAEESKETDSFSGPAPTAAGEGQDEVIVLSQEPVELIDTSSRPAFKESVKRFTKQRNWRKTTETNATDAFPNIINLIIMRVNPQQSRMTEQYRDAIIVILQQNNLIKNLLIWPKQS